MWLAHNMKNLYTYQQRTIFIFKAFVKVEKLFNINLPNEDVERIETVKDATDCVERQLLVFNV